MEPAAGSRLVRGALSARPKSVVGVSVYRITKAKRCSASARATAAASARQKRRQRVAVVHTAESVDARPRRTLRGVSFDPIQHKMPRKRTARLKCIGCGSEFI